MIFISSNATFGLQFGVVWKKLYHFIYYCLSASSVGLAMYVIHYTEIAICRRLSNSYINYCKFVMTMGFHTYLANPIILYYCMHVYSLFFYVSRFYTCLHVLWFNTWMTSRACTMYMYRGLNEFVSFGKLVVGLELHVVCMFKLQSVQMEYVCSINLKELKITDESSKLQGSIYKYHGVIEQDFCLQSWCVLYHLC